MLSQNLPFATLIKTARRGGIEREAPVLLNVTGEGAAGGSWIKS